MFVAIFIEAIIISAFFDQQERRHKLELQLEYEKVGKNVPVEPPKLPRLESFANILVGLVLAEIGGIGLWAFVGLMMRHGTSILMNQNLRGEYFTGQTDFVAAFIAGGIALMILGVKSLRAHARYRDFIKENDKPASGARSM